MTVLAKVREGAPLNTQEETQYGYVLRSVLYDVQEAFLLHEEGRLDEGYWSTRGALIQVYLSSDLAHEIYRKEKQQGLLHPKFSKWIDQNVKKEE